jgi:hypothetical protein
MKYSVCLGFIAVIIPPFVSIGYRWDSPTDASRFSELLSGELLEDLQGQIQSFVHSFRMIIAKVRRIPLLLEKLAKFHDASGLPDLGIDSGSRTDESFSFSPKDFLC